MKLSKLIIVVMLALFLLPEAACAQAFSDSKWKQNTIVDLKWSPLYYELNIGANVNPSSYSADFIYFCAAYGKPTSKNTWKNYIKSQPTPSSTSQPTQPSEPSGPTRHYQPSPPSPPDGSGNGGETPSEPSEPSQPSEPSEPTGSMSGLHAGMIGVGWRHFFNHIIGAHLQVGWGFVADFSSSSGNTSSMKPVIRSGDEDDSADGPQTFIYNTAPIQAGVDLCLWEQLVLQVGVTYMWKNTPTITVGAGFAF